MPLRYNLDAKIERRDELIQEAQSFGPFHDVATDAADCMFYTQQRDRDILVALHVVLDLAREGRVEMFLYKFCKKINVRYSI